MIQQFERRLAALPMILGLSCAAYAQDEEAEPSPQFGGPDSVERIIESDRTDRGGFLETEIFTPVQSWQSRMEADYGFSIGADYSAVTAHASDVLDDADDSASGGMVRFYGRWNLTGDGLANSSAMVYKIEHRHAYGDPAPSDFFLGNVGYAGLTEPPLSDQYTLQLFYRWQLTQQVALTLDYQYLMDPALNPDESSISVWSLRARFAL